MWFNFEIREICSNPIEWRKRGDVSVRGSGILGSVAVDGLSCNFTKYTNLLDQPLIVRLYFRDKVLKIAYPILLRLLVWIVCNLIVEMCNSWMGNEWKGDGD